MSSRPGWVGSSGWLLGSTPRRAAVGRRFRRLANCDLRLALRRRVQPPSSRESYQRPLEGVTIVEFATIIAAPLGSSMLADLGARVIKVEPLDGDPFRGMMGGLGAARVNAGKESICVDLKSVEGQLTAQRLIARADVLIHNYRVGVPERLGIGYADACKANPRDRLLVGQRLRSAGPGCLRPSTHPIPGAALGGVVRNWAARLPDELLTGRALREAARRIARANELNPDPNTSLVVATATTLGLAAVARCGVGQAIFVDMFGANAYANFDDFFDYPGKPARAAVDADGFGLSDTYRLYPCQDGWIFVAIAPQDREAFRQLVLRHGDHNDASLEAAFERRNGRRLDHDPARTRARVRACGSWTPAGPDRGGRPGGFSGVERLGVRISVMRRSCDLTERCRTEGFARWASTPLRCSTSYVGPISAVEVGAGNERWGVGAPTPAIRTRRYPRGIV